MNRRTLSRVPAEMYLPAFRRATNLPSFTHLIIGAGVRAGSGRTLSALTVDGAAATYVQRSTATGELSEVWVKEHTTTNPVLSFTASGGCTSGGICVVAVNELSSITPTDVETDTGDPVDFSLDIAEGGIAFAVCMTQANGAAAWTGLDELGNDGESSQFTAAARAFASAVTGHAIQADFTPNPSRATGVAASFR